MWGAKLNESRRLLLLATSKCPPDSESNEPVVAFFNRPSLAVRAIWFPDKTLAKTCADFSDLEIGPDGCLYLLSDKSSTIARLDDLPAGGGTATLLDAWRLGD